MERDKNNQYIVWLTKEEHLQTIMNAKYFNENKKKEIKKKGKYETSRKQINRRDLRNS